MERITLACLFFIFLFSAPVAAATIPIHQGDDLQAILNQAQPGDTPVLDTGHLNATLPRRPSLGGVLTVRPTTPILKLPRFIKER